MWSSSSSNGQAPDPSILERFENAWKEGKPLSIEEALPDASSPARLPTLLALIKAEIFHSWKRWGGRAEGGGQQSTVVPGPRARDYLERFPCLRALPKCVEDLTREVAEARGRFDDSVPRVPGYEVLEPLGEGGMGVVYKARQLSLDREVALKMIQGPRGGSAGERFRTETVALKRLNHPNIVQVIDAGEADERPYLVMEFCPGGSLDEKLAGKPPQPPRVAAALVKKLADAVQAAHDKQIIHRDLKPGNVLVGADGQLKIADFGLARLLDQPGQTQTGAVLGTPSYMAPEQALGTREVREPADVYALGAILYRCITGRPPFPLPPAARADRAEIYRQVIEEPPAPPARLNPQAHADLETICLKCLYKEPHRRYASAQELADDLECYLKGEPIKARPPVWWEKAYYWLARNPRALWQGAAALLVLLLTVSLAIAGPLWYWGRQMEKGKAEAEKGKEEAEVAALVEKLYGDHESADNRLQLAGKAGTRARAFGLLREALSFHGKGDETLRQLEGMDGARGEEERRRHEQRWESRRVRLRNEATQWLTAWRLSPVPARSALLSEKEVGLAVVSGDGARIVVVAPDGTTCLCLETNGLRSRRVPLSGGAGPGQKAVAAALNPDGKALAVVHQGARQALLIATGDGRVRHKLPLRGQTGPLAGLRFASEGRLEFFGYGQCEDAAWEFVGGKWQAALARPLAPGEWALAGRLGARSSKYVAAVSVGGPGRDSIVVLPLRESEVAPPGIRRVVSRRPGRGVEPAEGGWVVWKANEGIEDELHLNRGGGRHSWEDCHQVCFGSKPNLLYVLTSKRLLLIDVETGARTAVARRDGGGLSRKTLLPHPDGVYTLEPAVGGVPLDEHGLKRSGEGKVELTCWNAVVPESKQPGLEHRTRVCSLDLAPDGLLITGAHDHQLRVWRGATLVRASGVPALEELAPGHRRAAPPPIADVHPQFDFCAHGDGPLVVGRTELVDKRASIDKGVPLRTDVHDAATGRLVHSFPSTGKGRLLRLPSPPLRSLQFRFFAPPLLSQDGRYGLVVKEEDGKGAALEAWSLSEGRRLGPLGKRRYRIENQLDAPFISSGVNASFSPSGRWMVISENGDGDTDVEIWKFPDVKLVGTVKAPVGCVKCLFDQQEERALLTEGEAPGPARGRSRKSGKPFARVVELKSARCLCDLEGFPEASLDVEFAARHLIGRASMAPLALGPNGCTVWDLGSGKVVQLGKTEWALGQLAEASPDGTRLLLYGAEQPRGGALSFETRVELWDLVNRKRLREKTFKAPSLPTASAPFGQPRLLSGGGCVYFAAVLAEAGGAFSRTRLVGWRWADGKDAEAPGEASTVGGCPGFTLWRSPRGMALSSRSLGKLVPLEKAAAALQWPLVSQDGALLVIGRDLWRTKSGKLLLSLPEGHGVCALGPKGHWVVSAAGTAGNEFWVWDCRGDRGKAAHKARLPCPVDGMEGTAGAVPLVNRPAPIRVNAKGDRLALPLRGLLHLWDANNNRPVTTIARAGHGAPVSAVAQHPGAGLIASGDEGGVVNLWGRRDGRFVGHLAGLRGPIRALQFSPDGKALASASDDGTVALWRADGKQLWACRPFPGKAPATCLAFRPRGDRLAAGSGDGKVALLDASRHGKVLASTAAAPSPARALAWSKSSGLLAAAWRDGEVRLLHPDGLKQATRWRAGEEVNALLFTAGERFLVTGGATVQFWDVRRRGQAWQFSPPKGVIQGLALSADGAELYVVDQSSRASRFDLRGLNRALGGLGLALSGAFPR